MSNRPFLWFKEEVGQLLEGSQLPYGVGMCIGKMEAEVKMAVFRTRSFHLFPTKGRADEQRREKSNICDLKAREEDFGEKMRPSKKWVGNEACPVGEGWIRINYNDI